MNPARGFTLLEILITLFVIALGVLGTAGLQAVAMKMSQGGQLRSQAVVLGLDLMERIEANDIAAIAGEYAPATLPTSYAKDCAVVDCGPSELATYDLVQFLDSVQAQLPSASVTITSAGAGPVTYTVQIDWEERISKSSTTAVTKSGATTVSASGKTEKFSFTAIKSFYNRALSA